MFAALRSPAVLTAILATGLAIASAWAVELHHPPTTQENLNFIWIILCAALVFFMQAGFSALESGLVPGPPHSDIIWVRAQVPGRVLHPTMR